MSAFKGLWASQWGVMIERILRAAIRVQIDNPHSTILGVARMLIDEQYRAQTVRMCTDPVIRVFWQDFAEWDRRDRQQAVRPVLTRLDQITTNPTLRNIFSQVKSRINFGEIIDGKILVVDLSGKKLSGDAPGLVGGLLMAKLDTAVKGATTKTENQAGNFLVALDDMHHLRLGALPAMLRDAQHNSPRLAFAMSVPTLTDDIRNDVIPNVGSVMSFRTSQRDAELLADIIADPRYHDDDLTSLRQGECIARLWAPGMPYPIRADGFQPMPHTDRGRTRRDVIISRSRRIYGGRRSVIERKIRRFYAEPH